MKILHVLNTLLLAGILASLIVIVIHIRHPMEVQTVQPVRILNWGEWEPSDSIRVEVVNTEPIPVQIER